MSSYTTYNLTFRTGLHLGRSIGSAQTGQLGLQKTEVYIPGDTLFSALCQTWTTFYGENALETFLARYTVDGTHLPFRLTSAFPFAGDVRFFPKPLVRLNIDERKDAKKAKNIQFVSYNVFKDLLNDKTPELDNQLINGGKMWVDASEKEKLKTLLNSSEKDNKEAGDITVWKADSRPRVTLNRRSHESQIWHVQTLTFNKNCGLWFAVQFDDPNDTQKADDKSKIDTLLSVLGDNGIGGERNAGYGLFEFTKEKKSIELDAADKGSQFVTLSPICPKNEEQLAGLLDGNVNYSLKPCGGWGNSTGTAFQRKKVMMFNEGSVLTKTDGQVGRLVNGLEPDDNDACTHPVYRYGYAWPVGIKKGE